MAVHMLRISCQNPQNKPVDQLFTAIENWVAARDEVLPEQRRSMTTQNTAMDGSGVEYCVGDYRFAWESESKPELLTGVEKQLQQFCSWWRIKYHVCDHDEQDRGGCSWDDVQEYGPVPDELA